MFKIPTRQEQRDQLARRLARRQEAEALEDDSPACPDCGATGTVELHDERQTISVCAGCGSDQ